MNGNISKRLVPWIARVGLAVLLLSLSLLASAPQPAAAAGPYVEITRSGSELQFSSSTAVAVTWDIWLSTASIETNPYPPHFPTGGTLPPRVKRSSSGGTAQTSFAPFFGELYPNRVYSYIVRAGNVYTTGQVRTLSRKVSIRFDKIDVIDDSDDLSPGDLSFAFNYDGNWGYEWDTAEAAVSSGSSLPVNFGFFSIYPEYNSLILQVEGIDNDDDAFDNCPPTQLPGGGSDSDECFEWATAKSGNIYIPGLGPTNANFVTKQVSFQTTANRLKFKVFTTITVQYS